MQDFELQINPQTGTWDLCTADNILHSNVSVVRAFPISDPDGPVSILDAEGREAFWIHDLHLISAKARESLLLALQVREFMPIILQVHKVSSFMTPSTWFVVTNRGECRFVLKGEEDIRRLSSQTLLLADENGVQFLIKDLTAMDRKSRKLLDRFL